MRVELCAVQLAAFVGIVTTAVSAFADAPAVLKQLRPLGPAIEALPRLAAKPSDNAAKLINRALASADSATADTAADCKAMGKKNSSFTRSVRVTMRGPLYVSVVETNSWYCGGAYPDWATTAFVYDLTTGTAVDWSRFLPPALVDRTADYNRPDEKLIVSAALTKLYLPAPTDNPECREALTSWEGGLAFALWPDAAAGGIAIEPDNLPHVVKACGPPVTIATTDLRGLGVDPALLDAIDTAHRLGWYDKPSAKR